MQNDTSVINLNTSLIIPNKYQPRKVFDESSLESLAESIKNYGIINPILVRKKDDKYEIIAGERRFRAAEKIGLTEVPVIVKNADEQQMAELALIENIQRQGLTSIEEAKSYEEIIRIGNHTQASLAEKLGKSQSAIANKIRLLSLPQEIQDALSNKKISERHARSLLSLNEKEKQIELLNRIIEEKLTVKETEQIINSKEITEAEVKQAISDIMKSLNIEEEKELEKEDDNMNNGNFFPNFDNNNGASNQASLNMMNMQSMNQQPVQPEPEVVMPTLNQPVQPESSPTPTFEQFGPAPMPEPNMNQTFNPMGDFAKPSMTFEEPAMVNDALLFGNQFIEPTAPVEPQSMPQMSSPVVDEPLFNPNVVMPQVEEPVNYGPVQEPQVSTPTFPETTPNTFEIPVNNPQPIETPVVKSKLEELQEILNNNGYTYKTYSNDTNDCIIIELPKN